MATEAIIVPRQSCRKKNVVSATSTAPEDQVETDLLQRALDEARLVADDLQLEVRRHHGA